MITKEKYLEELKDTILTLKYKSQELKTSYKLLKKWNNKRKWLKDNILLFSESDKKWIETIYNIWIGDIFGQNNKNTSSVRSPY